MIATNVSLLVLLDAAYGFTRLTTNGPDWLNADRFDVTAKSPDGVPDTEMMPMLQALLKDRFKAQVHQEKRQMPVYDLVVANSGLKISPFDGAHFPATPPNRGGDLVIGLFTMADLAKTLTSLAGRPVVDETGLTGRYTLTLTFSSSLRTNESATAAGLPDLFTAVQEQLGLKLQANRRDAPILVVDSAERAPSEN